MSKETYTKNLLIRCDASIARLWSSVSLGYGKKETYIYEQRPINVTYIRQQRPIQETC